MQEGGFQGGVRLPEQEQQLRCPRCESTNTKFCYYNNYNLSQPRHFCKNCRRYWTKGGALRNIPVGGGTRKNSKRAKRPDASSSAAEEVPSAGDQIYRGEELQKLTRGGGDAAAEAWRGGEDGGGWTTELSMYAPRFG